MNTPDDPPLPKQTLVKKVIGLITFLGLLFWVAQIAGAEVSMTEYQVKAQYLVHFAKYIDWPPESFAMTNTPIVIGLYGEGKFGDELKTAMEGRTAAGRRIILQPIVKADDAAKCHILFVSAPNRKSLGEILARLKTKPVLTVGENPQFMEQGGVINFVMKADTVRLQINLDAARQANLKISSKLLGVADVVKGKLK
jgi:hypothetical protein